MKGIGIRVYSKSQVYYTIIESNDLKIFNYLTISHINVPIALERPERLNFIRNTIMDILAAYKIQRAAIRIPEFGGSVDVERTYLEGVIQESLAGSDVEKFVAAQIAQLTNVAQIVKTDFKLYADGGKKIEGFPESINWEKLGLPARESILTCLASLKL